MLLPIRQLHREKHLFKSVYLFPTKNHYFGHTDRQNYQNLESYTLLISQFNFQSNGIAGTEFRKNLNFFKFLQNLMMVPLTKNSKIKKNFIFLLNEKNYHSQ